jgi:uncharacterized membrane protein YjfL (UPF0719 family)
MMSLFLMAFFFFGSIIGMLSVIDLGEALRENNNIKRYVAWLGISAGIDLVRVGIIHRTIHTFFYQDVVESVLLCTSFVMLVLLYIGFFLFRNE